MDTPVLVKSLSTSVMYSCSSDMLNMPCVETHFFMIAGLLQSVLRRQYCKPLNTRNRTTHPCRSHNLSHTEKSLF